MNTKKILVSLCTIAIVLFLVATVSASVCTDCDQQLMLNVHVAEHL